MLGKNRQEDMMTCEDALFLFSRNLEGDLSGDEVADLYRHLAQCDDCRRQMGKAAAHISAITGLRRVRAKQDLRAGFCEQIEAAVRREKVKKPFGFHFPFRGFMTYRSHAASVLAGFIVAVLIGAGLHFAGWPKNDLPDRFYFNETAVQQIQAQSWNSPIILQPGQTVHITFQKNMDGSCHIKMVAPSGYTRIQIVHDDPDIVDDPVHTLTVEKALYSSLCKPVEHDRLIFTNRGSAVLTISLQPQVMKAITIDTPQQKRI